MGPYKHVSTNINHNSNTKFSNSTWPAQSRAKGYKDKDIKASGIDLTNKNLIRKKTNKNNAINDSNLITPEKDNIHIGKLDHFEQSQCSAEHDDDQQSSEDREEYALCHF